MACCSQRDLGPPEILLSCSLRTLAFQQLRLQPLEHIFLRDRYGAVKFEFRPSHGWRMITATFAKLLDMSSTVGSRSCLER